MPISVTGDKTECLIEKGREYKIFASRNANGDLNFSVEVLINGATRLTITREENDPYSNFATFKFLDIDVIESKVVMIYEWCGVRYKDTREVSGVTEITSHSCYVINANRVLVYNEGAEVLSTAKSAYEIACDNGFEGTETEWLESLKGGPQGPVGPQGPPGPAGADGLNAVFSRGFNIAFHYVSHKTNEKDDNLLSGRVKLVFITGDNRTLDSSTSNAGKVCNIIDEANNKAIIESKLILNDPNLTDDLTFDITRFVVEEVKNSNEINIKIEYVSETHEYGELYLVHAPDLLHYIVYTVEEVTKQI
jgi:hypothetical protein